LLERASKRLLKGNCSPAILLQTIKELLNGPPAQGAAASDNPSGQPNRQPPGITFHLGN
jgi:hypothetical protein